MNEFDELVALILEGLTYANVHTEKFPGGELRGQIRGAAAKIAEQIAAP